jgi:hypothetical protein
MRSQELGFGTKRPTPVERAKYVQQQGHTTAGMHDRGQRSRAAEVAWSSHAPVVRIQVVWAALAAFARTTTLNAAAYCASVSNIPASARSGSGDLAVPVPDGRQPQDLAGLVDRGVSVRCERRAVADDGRWAARRAAYRERVYYRRGERRPAPGEAGVLPPSLAFGPDEQDGRHHEHDQQEHGQRQPVGGVVDDDVHAEHRGEGGDRQGDGGDHG